MFCSTGITIHHSYQYIQQGQSHSPLSFPQYCHAVRVINSHCTFLFSPLPLSFYILLGSSPYLHSLLGSRTAEFVQSSRIAFQTAISPGVQGITGYDSQEKHSMEGNSLNGSAKGKKIKRVVLPLHTEPMKFILERAFRRHQTYWVAVFLFFIFYFFTFLTSYSFLHPPSPNGVRGKSSGRGDESFQMKAPSKERQVFKP